MKKFFPLLLCSLFLLSCTKPLTCEEKALQLVPDTVSLLQDQSSWILSKTNKLMNNTWKNGNLLLATESAYLKESEDFFTIRDDDKFAKYESDLLNFNATFTFQKIEGANRTVKGFHPNNIDFSLFVINEFSIKGSSITACAEN